MTRNEEIVWLAGLLEGEGSFAAQKPTGRSKRFCLVVQIKMTDLDVVTRAHAVFPTGRKVGHYVDKRKDVFADTYTFRWHAKQAEDVMRAVLPYMGSRRSSKIQTCLNTPDLSHHFDLKAHTAARLRVKGRFV